MVAYLRGFSDIPFSQNFSRTICENHPELLPTFYKFKKLAPRYEMRFKATNYAISQLQNRCFLELAAGFSPRGMSLALETSMYDYTEVDLPGVIEDKAKLIKHLYETKPVNLKLVKENVLLLDKHNEIMTGPPITIISEGLLKYLDYEEKTQLSSAIRNILNARGGAWVTPDITLSSFYKKVKSVSGTTDANGDKNTFTNLQEAINFFDQLGFDVKYSSWDQCVSSLTSQHALSLSHQELIDSTQDSFVFTLRNK